jgi:hypothetical protein
MLLWAHLCAAYEAEFTKDAAVHQPDLLEHPATERAAASTPPRSLTADSP